MKNDSTGRQKCTEGDDSPRSESRALLEPGWWADPEQAYRLLGGSIGGLEHRSSQSLVVCHGLGISQAPMFVEANAYKYLARSHQGRRTSEQFIQPRDLRTRWRRDVNVNLSSPGQPSPPFTPGVIFSLKKSVDMPPLEKRGKSLDELAPDREMSLTRTSKSIG